MLNKSDVKRILSDVLRTELARHQADALAVFEQGQEEDLLSRVPAEILQFASDKAAILFGYSPRVFSTLSLMTDYAFASFLKHRQINFLTSGSTGESKVCPHTLEMIEEEAYGLAPFFKGVKRIVSLVPSSHLYGFSFTVALPHALNVPVEILPALPTQPWEKILKEGDLLVGFPLFWNYWVRGGNQFASGVQALSSTAPCKDETIEALYAAGLSHFTEIYGASETGAIAVRHHAAKPFEILPFWEISLQEEQPQIKRKSQEEWLLLPDHVDLQNQRFLVPLGRNDQCVQVAGINVYPKRVEKVLASHPAVQSCRVRLMRAEEGERLKAFIVLNEGYTPEHLGIIRTFLAKRLTVHEQPRAFMFGKELPVSHLGKDADW